jgi:Kef-type K+ transport system membrane component KefB
VLVTGIAQFLLCVGLGIGLALLMGFTPARGNFDWLYLAITLALSSTLIVVKLLYDKFELTTLPGRITLGVLVCQDIWAIVFLALQPNLHEPHLGTLLESFVKGAGAGAHDIGFGPIRPAAFFFFRRQGPGTHVDSRSRLVFFGEWRSRLVGAFP